MKLHICDWEKYFEKASSKKLVRLTWVAIPNKMDGEGYTALVDHPNGAAHLGAWYAIVEVASKQHPRGWLPGGIRHDIGGICQSLGRISRLPGGIFHEVIPRLLEIGWLEDVESIQQVTEVVAESANVVAECQSHTTLHNNTIQEQLLRTTAEAVRSPQFREFPKTADAILTRFPTADLILVGRIVESSARAFVSVDKPKIPEPDDSVYADAVEAAAKETKKQTSAALFLRTVPNVIGNWAKHGRNGSAVKIIKTYTPPSKPKETENGAA